MPKTAVILFNLGGPDRKESIYPFLINFFMDKNIIRAPWPVRYLVSRLIARRRTKVEAGNAYGRLGGKSPLLENTTAQANALESVLNSTDETQTFKVFTCMRYWHPMAPQVVSEVADFAPDRVILLPLYPQYSTTTTRSSLQAWTQACSDAGVKFPTRMVCCYPFEDGFIGASAALIRQKYDDMTRELGRAPRVLFSAHGLPEIIIKQGDPYQWQCEETAKKIVAALGISDLDWMVCYQSRVGRLTWIGPSTDEAIQKAALDQVPILIYPHAFVSEHVETLVEIEEEYRHLAHSIGVPDFERVPTVGTHPEFINGLKELALETLNGDIERDREGAVKRVAELTSAPPSLIISNPPVCPCAHKDCCQRQFGNN
ncbi:MAG: ferrochelatase [Alphaproteobacteria bacterium]|nr:ferrochelatase [Alphaproteobacteria bacterium]